MAQTFIRQQGRAWFKGLDTTPMSEKQRIYDALEWFERNYPSEMLVEQIPGTFAERITVTDEDAKRILAWEPPSGEREVTVDFVVEEVVRYTRRATLFLSESDLADHAGNVVNALMEYGDEELLEAECSESLLAVEDRQVIWDSVEVVSGP